MTSTTISTLAIIGNLNIDLWIRPVDRFPSPDEERVVDSARLELAGTAGYALLASMSLGMDVVTVSTIGDDAFGQYIQQSAQRLGISLVGVDVLAGGETPISMVFIGSDGSRSIISTLGAHQLMDMDVVARHDDDIARCKEVFLCGNYLLPRMGPADVLEYAQAVRRRGQVVVFDPSWDPSGWTDGVRKETIALLRAVDIYMPNVEELKRLTGQANWRDAVRDVAAVPGEMVVKRGPQGSSYIRVGERIDVPAFEVEAVNTIGAGDVFDVGYLYARRMNWNPRRRLEFATALAAIIVSQTGTREYPVVETVLSFLRERLGEDTWGHLGPVSS